MFYCEECAKKNGWPFLAASRGPCEVCGRLRNCADIPSKNLPLPKRDDKEVNNDRT